MEEEFDIWVLSFDDSLAESTFDFTGVKVALPSLGNISQAFEAERAAPLLLASSEVLAALVTGVVDSAADSSPDFLQGLIAADPNLNLYRFTATTDGIVESVTISDETIFGTEEDDSLTGNMGSDQVFALGGNDVITATTGDDQIDGGAGDDTLNLTGPQAGYTLTLSPDAVVITDRTTGRDGADALSNIETLSFAASDTAFSISTFGGTTELTPDQMASFVELYIAYFDRAPDAIGLGFWGTAFANGTSLQEIAAFFIDQEETREAYPDSQSNSDFTRAVYDNVLGRAADQAGFDFWVGVLDAGTVTRDQFILEILAGAKAAPPPDSSQEFITQQLADQKFLSDKTDLGTYFSVILGMSDVENAAAAMALFDGSQASFNAALEAIDGYYSDALSADTGAFLLQLEGVISNPIEPFSATDDFFSLAPDTTGEINVLANDIGSGLRVDAFTENSVGALELLDATTGVFRYTPAPDFSGLDTFSYSVTNETGRSDIAVVSISVGLDTTFEFS